VQNARLDRQDFAVLHAPPPAVTQDCMRWLTSAAVSTLRDQPNVQTVLPPLPDRVRGTPPVYHSIVLSRSRLYHLASPTQHRSARAQRGIVGWRSPPEDAGTIKTRGPGDLGQASWLELDRVDHRYDGLLNVEVVNRSTRSWS